MAATTTFSSMTFRRIVSAITPTPRSAYRNRIREPDNPSSPLSPSSRGAT